MKRCFSLFRAEGVPSRRGFLFTRLAAALILPAALAGAPVRAAAPALSTVTVEMREVFLTYPAEAVVEAIHQATVASQVQGRVMEMRVDAGDKVKRGQVLMRIDERETAQAAAGADAQAQAASASLANAKASFERTRNLFTQKFVSQAALDQAEAAYKAAQGQFDAARAGHGQAATVKSFTTVSSPLTGVVAQRLVEMGEMAEPGKPLISVFEPGSLRVVASIPQYKLAEVRKNLKARVEFPDSGRWLDGVRVEVLPTADSQTHAVRARVILPGDGAGAVPGMFARAHFVIGQARKLVLPQKAVLRRGEVTAVYVQDGAGKLSLRQVRLGENLADGLAEVLAGISAGEKVVLDPVQAEIRLKQG
ncbi:MAG: efflux RND transporter periplasmic adaptor subunit [Rhodocyclaceae bacterium]|nr:efflux RND transporter periplasmic adaptor subunit [Rhodocyclaceae bacterium]